MQGRSSMVAGTIEDEQWTSRMSSSSSDARLRTRNESRETRVNRIVITRTPTVWRMRVIPHTLRHYVASRTILGKFGFGPFFRAHLSIHRLHSFDSFYPACMGPRAMNGTPSTSKLLHLDCRKALWQAHIGCCENHCVSSDISRHPTGVPVCSPPSR